MAHGPTVSVITPVYNGQDYLAECIQSVLQQTFADFEFVVVDNVSTDDSAAIVLEYAARDSRIRLVRESQFVAAIPNHNRAVRAMHSDARYMKFLHADDWLYPECLEQMVKVAELNPAVGVVSSFRLVGNQVEHQSPMPYTQSVMSGRDVVRWELLGPKGAVWVTGSNTSLLIRADLARRPYEFYDPTVWAADTDAAYRVLMESDFGFVHRVLTYTRRHAGAQTAFDYRVWSFISRDGRLLMRYGPRLLSRGDYQRRLRGWLWSYASWLAKQALKPSRRQQREFHDFHLGEIEYMLAEPGLPLETRLALSGLRRLLRTSVVDH